MEWFKKENILVDHGSEGNSILYTLKIKKTKQTCNKAMKIKLMETVYVRNRLNEVGVAYRNLREKSVLMLYIDPRPGRAVKIGNAPV